MYTDFGNGGQTAPGGNLLKVIGFSDGIHDNRHATGATRGDGDPLQQPADDWNNGSYEHCVEQRRSYSPPTPPHTPSKSRVLVNQENLRSVDEPDAVHHLQIPKQFDQTTKRLSPLSVSIDQTWGPVSPRLPERDPRYFAAPGSTGQPPPSPSVRVSFQFDEGIDPCEVERKREQLTKAFSDILAQKGSSEFDREADIGSPKPFPLQAPPKHKLKRQLSTDSNDSVEIKPSHKSPTKRQTINEFPKVEIENRQTDQHSCNVPGVRSGFHQRTYSDSHCIERNFHKENRENCETVTGNTPVYAQNIKWVLDKPSPTSEEDFKCVQTDSEKEINSKLLSDGSHNSRFHGNIQTAHEKRYGNMQTSLSASHLLSPKLNESPKRSIRHSMSCVNMNLNSFESGSNTPQSSMQEGVMPSFNAEMVSNYGQRGEQTGHSIETMSSMKSNPLVTEKGFVFPQKATVTAPIPFSPRIVQPNVSPFKMSSDNRRDSQHRNPQSMCSTPRNDFLPEREFYKLSHRELTELKHLFRSNSDVQVSPSKHEIEEMREFVRRIHRSVSDPSASPQHLKNMLQEERLLYNILCEENKRQHSPVNRHIDFELQSSAQNQFPHPVGTGSYRQAGPSDVKRNLFRSDSNYQDFHDGNPRFSTPKRETVIPDAIASILSSNNVLSQNEIQSINNIRNIPRFSSSQSESGISNNQSTDRTTPNFNRPEVPLERFPVDENEQYQEFPGQRCERCHKVSRTNTGDYDPSYSQQYSPTASCRKSSTNEHDREPKRQKKTGDIDVRVSCNEFKEKNRNLQEHLHQLQHSGKNCKCASVENEIMLMAREAYQKLRRVPSERFEYEVQSTNKCIFDSMEILCSIKYLCKNRRTIEDIYNGSIVFTVHCPSLKALDDLWSMYTSKEIEIMFNKDFENLLKGDMSLDVYMSSNEYMNCRTELELKESVSCLDSSIGNSTLSNSSISKSDTELCSIGSAKENNPTFESKKISSLAVIHMRSQSAPITRPPTPSSSPSWLAKSPLSPLNRERKFSFNVNQDQSQRKAFQELNIGKDIPCSPTMKKLFEFDITLSPKTSPKRKTFAESPPWEHENIHPELVSPKRKNFGNIFPFRSENPLQSSSKNTKGPKQD